MGIESLVEKAAGILAAEKALEAVDPNAGFVAKAAAAVAGYEGVSEINKHLQERADQRDDAAEDAAADAAATDGAQAGQ